MKADWEIKKLGEVCDFQGGAQPPKDEWIKNYKNGYVRMLQIRDFTQSRNFDIEYVKITNKLRRCTTDDILLGRYGASVGKVLTGLEGAYNVAILKTIPSEIIQKMYIKYYFLSPLFQIPLLNLCNQRAAQAGFNREDISDFPIPVPSLVEQKRIVEILDQKFAQIDQLKQNAEKNLQNAKDLFQAELTKAFSNDSWEKKRLGDVCGITSGGTPSRTNKSYWEKGHIPWVKTTELQNNELNSTEEFITQKGLDESSAKIVPKDTILLAMYGQGKTRGMTAYLNIEATTNQACACIIPSEDKNIYQKFIWKFLIGNYENIRNLAIGCNQPNLNSAMVKNIVIPLPPLSEQKRIVEQLDSLSQKVRQLEEIYTKQIANCDELKQSFLKKAFEGEL